MKKPIKQIFLKTVLRRNLLLSLVSPEYELPEEIKPFENFPACRGKIPCNLNFDDLCPKYMDGYGSDFGGRIDKSLTVEFGNLLRDYPHITVTHFVIPLCMIEKNRLRFGPERGRPRHRQHQRRIYSRHWGYGLWASCWQGWILMLDSTRIRWNLFAK